MRGLVYFCAAIALAILASSCCLFEDDDQQEWAERDAFWRTVERAGEKIEYGGFTIFYRGELHPEDYEDAEEIEIVGDVMLMQREHKSDLFFPLPGVFRAAQTRMTISLDKGMLRAEPIQQGDSAFDWSLRF